MAHFGSCNRISRWPALLRLLAYGVALSFPDGVYLKISIQDKGRSSPPFQGLEKATLKQKWVRNDKVKGQVAGQVSPLSLFHHNEHHIQKAELSIHEQYSLVKVK